MSDTLVLNSNFCAVQVADWDKVFSLVWQGHAQVVDDDYRTYSFEEWAELSKLMHDHPNGYVNTVSLRLAIPDVIRLTRYERLPSSEVKFTRRNIYQHYKNQCCYCGGKFSTRELNLDHVMPRSRGGSTNWDNIVLSCIPCNTRKADRTPAEAGMKLLVQPKRPKWSGPMHEVALNMPFPMRQSWQVFIDKAYWSSELEND